jgi:hypothetical protein
MKNPKIKMVHIYGGKDPEWRGWYNLCLDDGDVPMYAIAGPIDPVVSEGIINALLDENYEIKDG